MLGHAKASMTLDTYADLFDDDLDLVAGALDAKIRAARETTAGRRGQLTTKPQARMCSDLGFLLWS